MKRHFRRLSPPITTTTAARAYAKLLKTSDAWLRGKAAARFESKLAKLAGVAPEQVIATASCTDALAAAGHVLFDDDHFPAVSPLTYAGTYSWAGEAFGRWVDCDDEGWPVAPVDVHVELWGRARLGPFGATIIDGAHRFRPGEVGQHFEAGTKAVCWSFGPQKELPGVRGGAVVFSDGGSASAARAFLNNGIGAEGPTGAPGRKGFMANAEAVFLEHQLPYLENWRARRQRVLEWYAKFFPPGSPVAELMTRPGEASGHLCVLRFQNRGMRDIAAKSLSYDDITTSVHYPVPPDAPEGCQRLSGRILTVPCHPQMAFIDVRRVALRIIRST